MHTAFWYGMLKERDNLHNLDADGRILYDRTLQYYNVKIWTEFLWLKTGTNCELLWTFLCCFGLRKERGKAPNSISK